METTYHVYLGGNDAEMAEIKKVATQDERCIVHDAGLGWGAKASDYLESIEQILFNNSLNDSPQAVYDGMKNGQVAPQRKIKYVFVELEVDEKFTKRIAYFLGKPLEPVVIDHHGDRAGEPPAIIQFLKLLGIAPTRNQRLIGAMDAAWVPGLEALNATPQEVAEFLEVKESAINEMVIEAADQFITAKERKAAIKAVRNAKVTGDLIVTRCAHSKCAPITARLHGAQDVQNVLVISDDGELNFFGTGEKVKAIANKVQGGWSGGAGLCAPTAEGREFWTRDGGCSPSTAFWGCSNAKNRAKEVIAIAR